MFVNPKYLTVFNHRPKDNNHPVHVLIRSPIDQIPDGVPDGAHVDGFKVHKHQVSLRTDLDPAQIPPPEGVGSIIGCQVEQVSEVLATLSISTTLLRTAPLLPELNDTIEES